MLGVEVFRDKQGLTPKSRDGKKEEEGGAAEGEEMAAVGNEAELEDFGEDQSSEPKTDISNKES